MHENLIAGEWMKGEATPDVNPSDTTDIVGEYAFADAAQTEMAIAAATRAFPAWSRTTPQQRFDLLDDVGTRILADRKRLGTLLAREEGKTLPEAIGEVVRAGNIFKFFAGEALRPQGEIVPSVRPGITCETTREPLGVVGLITPWNFPIAIPAWKIAPALAFGNTVVFKPAELVPGSAHALAQILRDAGVPAGVFNLVMGRGSVVGAALVASRDVAAVSFTGSVATGSVLGAQAMAAGKRIQLEMGGKNPLVVLDDANLDVAVAAAINGAFFSTGQRCTASSRLVVTRGIHDRFVEAMQKKMATLKVGDALEEGIDIGPVVDARQLAQDERYIALAREEGCTVVGGERLERARKGFYLAPALLLGARNTMVSAREEIFGPVASVIEAADDDEALAIANDTPFGLAAGVCTTSLARTARFKRELQSGLVMVNLPTAGIDYHVAFGGRKASSHGPREQGTHARDFYTVVKTAYIQP